MTDKLSKFDCLIESPVPKSLINEPIDFTVDFTLEEPKSALDRAWRRWQHAELIRGDRSE